VEGHTDRQTAGGTGRWTWGRQGDVCGSQRAAAVRDDAGVPGVPGERGPMQGTGWAMGAAPAGAPHLHP